MQQGRRTASLKASYEAVSRGTDLAKDLQLTKEYNAPSTPSVTVVETKTPRTKKYVEINRQPVFEPFTPPGPAFVFMCHRLRFCTISSVILYYFMSSLMLSSHLFLGLPLLPLPCTCMFNILLLLSSPSCLNSFPLQCESKQAVLSWQ